MAKSRKSVLVILSILTVAASITKILIGLDFDENYITVLGARLLQGDHLFRECWDLYQTTGFTMALVLGILKGITGGYEGAILFCRIVTAILQLLLGMFTWYSLRKYFRNADFAGLVVANMLPRGTLNLEYGFLSCNYILISMLLLFLVSREEKNWSKVKVYVLLILSGILFSMGILCYPTMIIATIVLIAYFFSIRENRRKGLIFIGTCIACAVVFCLYVFAYISPSEMLDNVFHGILMDESHGNENLLGSFVGSFVLSKEKMVQVFAILIVALITYIAFQWKNKEKLPFVYHVMFWSSVAIIGMNISTIRPCGVFGLQIRYTVIALAGALIIYKLHDRELSYLFYGMGMFMFLGTLLGSNLGMAENSAFWYISLIAIVLGEGEQIFSKKTTHYFAILSVAVLLISLIFMKGYIVRVNGTGPANILETREQIDFGPFKGLFIDPEEKSSYLIRKDDIDENLTEKDTVLILSQDPVYNICAPYRFSSATALTTPVYGNQWVEYYKRNYVQPTVVLIDKQYLNADSLLNHTVFGAYLKEEYDENFLYETKGFWILRR